MGRVSTRLRLGLWLFQLRLFGLWLFRLRLLRLWLFPLWILPLWLLRLWLFRLWLVLRHLCHELWWCVLRLRCRAGLHGTGIRRHDIRCPNLWAVHFCAICLRQPDALALSSPATRQTI